MKTAISIPDKVFALAEKMARRLGVSRSQLYSTAVREYVDAHKTDRVSERLDAVYGDQELILDSALVTMQTQSFGTEDW
jgi:metal-responsive CopG/Arc/MetJ family transcriptional regulator